MDEYISKQTFKEKYLCCGWLPEMSEEEFDAFPAGNVAEVVRCRECVHNHPEFVGNETQWCEICRTTINLDDFCSQGQRKTKTVLPKSGAKDESLEADHEVSEQDGRSAIHCCCSK